MIPMPRKLIVSLGFLSGLVLANTLFVWLGGLSGCKFALGNVVARAEGWRVTVGTPAAEKKIPAPLILLVSGAGVIACLVAYMNYREAPPERGKCPGCGYDIRANTDRCSECGMPIVPPFDDRDDGATKQ